MAALKNKHWDTAVCFLMHETEDLAELPYGQGIQAVANVCTLLDNLPTVEPNTGAGPCDRVPHKSAGMVASYMLTKFGNFLGQVKTA